MVGEILIINDKEIKYITNLVSLVKENIDINLTNLKINM